MNAPLPEQIVREPETGQINPLHKASVSYITVRYILVIWRQVRSRFERNSRIGHINVFTCHRSIPDMCNLL